jgi:hypothetical protein
MDYVFWCMLEFSSATCCAWISLLVINAVHLQVYSSSLVDIERDFLSIDKRYPRLFVSQEFSKVSLYYLFSFFKFI